MRRRFWRDTIAYFIENGLNFYKRPEVKVLLDYLRFINDPLSEEGDEALRAIINIPNRYIGKAFMEEVEEYAEHQKIHFYEALKKMFIKIPYVRKNVRTMIEILDPLIEDAKTIGPSELIYLLRNGLEYDKYISEGDIPTPDDSRIANIDQLQMAANKFKDIKSFLDYTEGFQGRTLLQQRGRVHYDRP